MICYILSSVWWKVQTHPQLLVELHKFLLCLFLGKFYLGCSFLPAENEAMAELNVLLEVHGHASPLPLIRRLRDS